MRTLLIAINAQDSSEAWQAVSARLQACAGQVVSEGPSLFQVDTESRRCNLRQSKHLDEYIGSLDGFRVVVRCRKSPFRGIGCQTRFPYEGFVIRLEFHRNHLTRWTDIVGEAKAFLDSKQYHDQK